MHAWMNMTPADALHALTPIFAQTGAEPSSDLTGLLVVAGILVAMGLAAVIMTRKPPSRTARGQEVEKKKPATPDELDREEKKARATAKALRRAARGAIKVKKSGDREQIEAVDWLAEQQAQLAPEPAPTPEPEPDEAPAVDLAEEERERLRGGLSKTRKEGFVARIGKLFAGKQIDEDLLDKIEEVLYRADIGVQATTSLLDALKKALSRKELTDPEMVWKTLKAQSLEMLQGVQGSSIDVRGDPAPGVLMVVGVNGSGKTTTIGKLAHRYAAQGRNQLVVAGDTFRAAAVDQLEVWCGRAGVQLFRGKDGADPASVCFSALKQSQEEGRDLVIVDTAGRLHTNRNLMAELQKVARVCDKAHPGSPHEVLLVLDATMGQNAVQQARMFKEAIDVTAIALTKLDGTAKGGVVLAIAASLGLPVKLIGVGEKMEDLRDFDAEIFVDALFDQDQAGAPS